MTGESPVVTVEEVADALQVSRYTVYRWARTGVCDTVDIPFRGVRIKRAWLDQKLAAQEQRAS